MKYKPFTQTDIELHIQSLKRKLKELNNETFREHEITTSRVITEKAKELVISKSKILRLHLNFLIDQLLDEAEEDLKNRFTIK